MEASGVLRRMLPSTLPLLWAASGTKGTRHTSLGDAPLQAGAAGAEVVRREDL